MIYYVMHYWPWLAAAAVVGVATPFLADRFGWAADLADYWLQRIGVVLAIAVVFIVARLAAGKPELMLEAGAGLVAAYIIGGIAGGLATHLLPARFEGWWVGLFATGLIWLVFGITTMPKIEPDLRERVAEVVKGAGADPLNFDVIGRDVLLPEDLGKARAELGAQILQVSGVRLVSEVEELTGAALSAKTVAKLQTEVAAKAEAEAKAKAEAEARDAVEKAAADAAAREAAAKAAKETAAKHAAAKAKDDAEAKEAAAKAAADAAAKEAATKEAAAKAAAEEAAKHAAAAPSASIPPPVATRTADAAGAASIASVEACQSKLSTLVAAQKINFERGSAEIEQASLPVLKQLAAVISHCPAAQIEVAGHTDANGKKAANEALSKRRAEAVADSLTKAGIGSAKLIAVGYGSAKPLGPNDTAEARAKNRRIEFAVK